MSELFESLKDHAGHGAYPFHMPGHKRSGELPAELPYSLDITEISGFDDLHAPSGMIKTAQEKAARLFGSKRAYMLVNGSTCGILAAVSSCAYRGDSVIMARNCHRSAYNACALSELDVRFVYPPMDRCGICGSIPPESIAAALDECAAKAVIITSPTYEGVVSDVENIARICHEKDVPLIVDSAHGAHMSFCSFGKSGEPIAGGADIVIESLHKTLPSLTQTAAAFLNGDIVSAERFEKNLSVFQTSSPSYILMASMEVCFDHLENSKKAFANYEKLLRTFYASMKKLERLRVVCRGDDEHAFFSFDRGKLVIDTSRTSITGVELMRRLREDYSLELEMAYPTYALAMTSVCDTKEGFERLAQALIDIDKTLEDVPERRSFPSLPKPMRVRMTNAELDALPDVELTREQASSGRHISRRYIYAYPPGIPIVTPGEIVGVFEYEYMEMLKKSGVRVVMK